MRLTKKQYLILAVCTTILMTIYAQFVLGHFSQCFKTEEGINSLGLSFGYTTADVFGFLEKRSNEQLTCYLSFLRIWDGIFPIIYTLMYSFWIIYFFKPKTILLLVPILHMLTDWTENIFESLIIKEYLTAGILNDEIISFSSIITSLKWILSIGTYLILLYGIFIKMKIILTMRKSG